MIYEIREIRVKRSKNIANGEGTISDALRCFADNVERLHNEVKEAIQNDDGDWNTFYDRIDLPHALELTIDGKAKLSCFAITDLLVTHTRSNNNG